MADGLEANSRTRKQSSGGLKPRAWRVTGVGETRSQACAPQDKRFSLDPESSGSRYQHPVRHTPQTDQSAAQWRGTGGSRIRGLVGRLSRGPGELLQRQPAAGCDVAS